MKNKLVKQMLCVVLAAQMAAGSGLTAIAQEPLQIQTMAENGQETDVTEPVDLMQVAMIEQVTGWGDFRTDGKSAGNKPITLWDGEKAVEYGRGIGMHSFSSDEMARAVYDISGFTHNTFRATVGVDYNSDDQGQNRGDCEFKVFVDGEEVYSSGVMTCRDKAKEIVALIPEGAKRLTLAVTNADNNNNCDHADWVDPRLEQDPEAETLFGTFKAEIEKSTLKKGDEVRITAKGRYVNGDAIENIEDFCTFASNNEEVAAVDEEGKVTALAQGNAVITVTAVMGNITKTASIPIVVMPSLEDGWSVKSPSGNMEFILLPTAEGSLKYLTFADEEMVIQPSALGLNTSLGDFKDGLVLESQESREINETYDMLSGKKDEYVNHCNETTFTFTKEGAENVKFKVIVRAYDDGIAYRYAIDGEGELKISSEYSSYLVPAGSKTTVLGYGGMGHCYEDSYASEMIEDANGKTYNMPFLYRTPEDKWVLLTEAALSGEYTGTVLKGAGNELKVTFTPKQNTDVVTAAPWVSPWRTAIIGGAEEIMENTMTENLSPECKIEDTSWIQPGTTAWTWYVSPGWGPQSDPELIKKYIDVAAEFGWKYYLMDEGWQGEMAPGNNIDGDWHKWVGIPDWLDEVVAYGEEKGVGIMAWVHSGDLDTPKEQEFFKELHDHGIVGMKIDFFDDESQKKLKHYEKMYELAAENEMIVDIHGCNKPTGEIRTWPNLLTREGIRGQEFNDNRAVLDVRLAYTRAAVGPSDFNPSVDLQKGGDTTASHNTALNIIYETGLPCPSDKGESYKSHHLVSLIENLPASWDETMFIGGDPDSYATLARRSGEDWFAASISTDAREEELSLDFLGDGTYTAYIYEDGAGRWDIDFSMKRVTAEDTLTLSTVKNGGYTVKFVKGEPEALEQVQISEEAVTLKLDETKDLTVETIPAKGQNNALVSWESSDDSIVSVDENGRLKAHKVGKAEITAKAVLPYEGAEQVVSAPCKVTVEMDELQIAKTWTRNKPDSRMKINSETSITLYPLNGEVSNNEQTVKNYMTLEEQTADEDFVVTVKSDFAPTGDFQTSGITVTTEDSGVLGMWRRHHSHFGNNVFGVMKHTGGFDETYQKETNVGAEAWLKLEKVGNNFTGYYSYDNENWTKVSTKSLDLGETEKIQIAVMAFSGTVAADSSNPATLENFTYNGTVIPFAEKPEQLEITGVESLSDIQVAEGTEAEELRLPEYVTVQLSDGTETTTSVTWDIDSYDSKNGTYTISGTPDLMEGLVNPADIKVKATVIVGTGAEEAIYTIIVDGKADTYAYNEKVIITAPKAPEGEKFAGWSADGKIVSTDETYMFYVSNHTELTSTYIAEEENVEEKAEAFMTNTVAMKRADGKYDVRFVGQLAVPEGYTIEEAGLVWSTKDGTELAVGGTLKPTYITKISDTNQFSVTIKGLPAGRFLRGKIFAKVVDGEGNARYIYSAEKKVVTKK